MGRRRKRRWRRKRGRRLRRRRRIMMIKYVPLNICSKSKLYISVSALYV